MTRLVDRVCQSYLPSTWIWMSPWEQEKSVDVDKNTNEYQTVKPTITCSVSLYFTRVTRIVRIQNPYIWGCYLLKKEEYERRGIGYQELKLYHNTLPENAESIAKNNFNWRCSGRRAKYGRGVSFSHSAEYALNNSSTHGKALIVARVLIGKTDYGSWYQEMPNGDADTTTSGGTKCNVYVKYSDNEFYPEYIVYY